MTTQQITLPREVVEAALEALSATDFGSGSQNREARLALRAALQAQAAAPHAFNDESPFCVKCGSTGDDSVAPVAHILPRMLKILKFKSMPVPVDPLPYDNGEEKTVPLYTTPQPTPDAEAMRLALEALKQTRAIIKLNLEEINTVTIPNPHYTWELDAAIAALEKVKGPTP